MHEEEVQKGDKPPESSKSILCSEASLGLGQCGRNHLKTQRTSVTGSSWSIIFFFPMRSNLKYNFCIKISLIVCKIQEPLYDKTWNFRHLSLVPETRVLILLLLVGILLAEFEGRYQISWKKSFDKPRQSIKKQRYHFAFKGLYNQSYDFSSSHVWM